MGCCSWNLMAQVIEVKDDEGNPVPAAIIRNDAGEVRMTDVDGRLELDSIIRTGDTLEVRSLGFGSRSMAMPTSISSMEVNLSPESVNLSEVVVASIQPERERSGAATISRLSSAEVTREAPSNAATLLWRSGEVHIQQSQQGGGSPVLRGFEANRILLVIDGVRMNNAIYRSGHLQNAVTLDPFSLQGVEVFHGAGSVRFGSDALGGVIHYRTRSPRWDTGVRARSAMSFGSAATSPSLHADVEWNGGRLAVLTSLTHRRYGDLRMGKWRPHGDGDWGRIPWLLHVRTDGGEVRDSIADNPDLDLQPGTGYHQTDLVQKVRYGRRDRHVELNIQHSTGSDVPRFDRLNDTASPGVPKWAQWAYGPQNRSMISARFIGRVRHVGMVAVTGAWQQIDESRRMARFGQQEREVQSEHVEVLSLGVDVDRMIRGWRTSAGFQLSHDAVDSKAWAERRADGMRLENPVLTRYPNGGSEMGSWAAYTGMARSWNNWSVQAAGRYTRGWLESRFEPQAGVELPFDRVSYARGALTGSSTLRWTPHRRMGLHAVIASAFRNPNVDDVGKVRAKDGFAILPSDGVAPERLASAEFGGRWSNPDGRLVLSASAFNTRLRDMIVPVDTVLVDGAGNPFGTIVVEGDTNLVQVNANLGRAGIHGSQWKFSYRGASGWTYRATMNFTRGRDLEEGAPLSHIPPAFGRCSAERTWDWLTLEGHLMWSGRKAAEDYGPGSTDNLAEALPDGNPAWWTLGVDLEGRLTDRMHIALGVHNLLDQHYKVFASGISAPGRDFRCGIRWSPSG